MVGMCYRNPSGDLRKDGDLVLPWSCINTWINPGIKFRFHEKSDSDYPSHTDMSLFNHLVTNDDITCQYEVVTKNTIPSCI